MQSSYLTNPPFVTNDGRHDPRHQTLWVEPDPIRALWEQHAWLRDVVPHGCIVFPTLAR